MTETTIKWNIDSFFIQYLLKDLFKVLWDTYVIGKFYVLTKWMIPIWKYGLNGDCLQFWREMICKFYLIVTRNLYVIFPIYNVVKKMQIMSLKISKNQKRKTIFQSHFLKAIDGDHLLLLFGNRTFSLILHQGILDVILEYRDINLVVSWQSYCLSLLYL